MYSMPILAISNITGIMGTLIYSHKPGVRATCVQVSEPPFPKYMTWDILFFLRISSVKWDNKNNHPQGRGKIK